MWESCEIWLKMTQPMFLSKCAIGEGLASLQRRFSILVAEGGSLSTGLTEFFGHFVWELKTSKGAGFAPANGLRFM